MDRQTNMQTMFVCIAKDKMPTSAGVILVEVIVLRLACLELCRVFLCVTHLIAPENPFSTATFRILSAAVRTVSTCQHCLLR